MKLFSIILAATVFAQNATEPDVGLDAGGLLGLDERRRSQEQIQSDREANAAKRQAAREKKNKSKGKGKKVKKTVAITTTPTTSTSTTSTTTSTTTTSTTTTTTSTTTTTTTTPKPTTRRTTTRRPTTRARNPITAPKPQFNGLPQNGDRNMNNQQVASSGQRDSSGNLWCYVCSGGLFEDCTQAANLRQCSRDQDFCMVELRTQPAQGGKLRMAYNMQCKKAQPCKDQQRRQPQCFSSSNSRVNHCVQCCPAVNNGEEAATSECLSSMKSQPEDRQTWLTYY